MEIWRAEEIIDIGTTFHEQRTRDARDTANVVRGSKNDEEHERIICHG